MKKYSGFTLMELLITMVVIAILAAIAFPSFEDMTIRNRTSTTANNILGSLKYARSEAASQGLNVQVSPLVAGTDWSQGWQIRTDNNNDGDFLDAGDLVIRVYEAVTNSTLSSGAATTLVFLPSGELGPFPPVAAITLTLSAHKCNGSGRNYQRIINIGSGGTSKISPNGQAC